MTKMTRISLFSVSVFALVSTGAFAATTTTTTSSNSQSVQNVPTTASDLENPVSRVNIEAGSTMSRGAINQDTFGNQEAKFGFATAATVDFGHGPFVFQTGLGFRQLGLKFSNVDTDFGRGTASSTVNYFSIPLLAKYYFGGKGGQGFFVRGGVSPAYAVSEEIRNEFDGNTVTSDGSFSGTSRWDVLASVGVGTNIELSKTVSLLINLDAMYGLVNLNQPNANEVVGTDLSVHNEAISLTAGVAFNL